MGHSGEDRALIDLGRWLLATGYRFVTPTPATHARVNARQTSSEATSIEGALGWSRPFRAGTLPAEVEELLARAGALERCGEHLRSAVRFSTLDLEGGRAALHVHSAHPTSGADAVFFGPDTYRFVSLLRRTVAPCERLVDVGAGTGAGGLSLRDRARAIVLADVNPVALRYARINAELAGALGVEGVEGVEVVQSDVLGGVTGSIDAVIANPPYLVDDAHRVYRDGGGPLGFDLTARIVQEAMARLSPGGRLVLYTGSPVVNGQHPLRDALAPALAARAASVIWEELDPDVFGEELEQCAYFNVERIALLALVACVRQA